MLYRKDQLDNGLKIVTHQMPHMDSVSLGIWIKVGGRYEAKVNKGITHFLEHLLFKGSKRYPGRKIKQCLEGVGGSLNGFTSEEMTCYLVKIPSQHIDLALDILSDMVLNPRLDENDVQKERGVIMEEIKMHHDLPQSYVYEILDNLLWPNHPLGMDLAGTFESVASITRNDLFRFKEKFYKSPNIVVACAGKLVHERLTESARRIFKAKSGYKQHSFMKAKDQQSAAKLNIFAKDTEQTHLALGFHALKRDHPDRYALGLLHVILGANMSSRLFNEVREKRALAYDIGTQVKRLDDTGAFIVHAGIANNKVDQTLRVILKELRKITVDSVSEGELKRAKEFYVGQLMLALEDTLDHMAWIGETTVALDKIYTIDEVISQVSDIRREDLKRIAKNLFKIDKINLALIGPLEGREKEIEKCFSC